MTGDPYRVEQTRISSRFFAPAMWASWASGRVLALLLLANTHESGVVTDLRIYHSWARNAWDHGVLPGRDYAWEYPIGAFPLIALPVRALVPYAVIFAVIALVLDGLVVARLQAERARQGDGWGLYVWLIAPTLLGSLTVLRLDIVPTALCVTALLSLSRPRRAGVFLGIAALVKIWPIALIPFLVVHLQRRRALLLGFAFACAGGVAVTVASGLGAALTNPFTAELRRGVQVESIAALPWMWLRAMGGDVMIVRLESFEVHEAGVTAAAWAVTAVGGVALLMLLRLAADSRVDVLQLSAAAVIVLVLSDKVFSPQYVVWIIGLTCVALTREGPYSGRLAAATCTVGLLTHIVFPLGYPSFLSGSVLMATVITTRDGLLLYMTTLFVARARHELPARAA